MRRVEAASISTAAQPLDGGQLVPEARRLGEPRSSSSGSSRVDHRNHANGVPSSLGRSRATAASMPAGRSAMRAGVTTRPRGPARHRSAPGRRPTSAIHRHPPDCARFELDEGQPLARGQLDALMFSERQRLERVELGATEPGNPLERCRQRWRAELRDAAFDGRQAPDELGRRQNPHSIMRQLQEEPDP
jgi:hypothetical protein